jgi:hypothetical protein
MNQRDCHICSAYADVARHRRGKGNDFGALVDDSGRIDPERVTEAVAAVLDDRPQLTIRRQRSRAIDHARPSNGAKNVKTEKVVDPTPKQFHQYGKRLQVGGRPVPGCTHQFDLRAGCEWGPPAAHVRGADCCR